MNLNSTWKGIVAVFMMFLIAFLPVNTVSAFSITNVEITEEYDNALFEVSTDADATVKVDFGTDENYGSSEENATLQALHSLTLQDLNPFTTYFYKVTATDENAEEDEVNGTFLTPHSPPPEQVVNLTQTGKTETSISIGWSAVGDDDVGLYNVYRNNELYANSTQLTFTDNNVQNGQTYMYQVAAYDNDDNEGVKSDPVFAATEEPDTDAPIISDVNIAMGDVAQVSWATDEPATTIIQWGPTAALGFTETDGNLTSDHNAVLAGLTEKNTYFYVIKGCDEFGNCAETLKKSFIFGTDEVPPYLNFTVPEMTNKQYLNIEGIAEPHAFVQVFVNGILRDTQEDIGDEKEFTFLSVPLDVTASQNVVRMIAKDDFGNQATVEHTINIDVSPPVLEILASENVTLHEELIINGTVSEPATLYFYVYEKDKVDLLEPPQIDNLVAVGDDGHIKLSWDRPNVTDINRYYVYREDVGLIAETNQEEYRDDEVNDNTTYNYQVTVTDKLCTESAAAFATATSGGGNETRDLPEVIEPECRGVGRETLEVENEFTHTLSLKSGDNIIKIIAEDEAGNQFEHVFQVTSDNEPPAFLDINLDAISPSYLCQETISGRLDEPATVHVYLNGESEPSYTATTDEKNMFNIDVELSKAANLKVATSDRETANTLNTATHLEYGAETWQNKIRVVAVDASGNNESEVGDIYCANCGQGSDWRIVVGDIMPNEIVPRYLMRGIGQIGFTYNLSWQGLGEAPTIHQVSMDFYPLSDKQQEQYDTDWVRRPMRPIASHNPAIGYIEIPLRRIDADPDYSENDTRNLYEKEKNISRNHWGECRLPGQGCMRLPLMMTIEYGETGLQKQCWESEVYIQPPALNPDKIPKGFLTASIEAIDAALIVIDTMIEFLQPVTKFTLIGCLGMFVVTWLQYFGEYFSCAGIGDAAQCDCDGDQCATEECTACFQAKKKTLSVEKIQHYLCDRVFCPPVPTFNRYVNLNRGPENEESNCMNYPEKIRYDNINADDSCEDAAVPPFTQNDIACCEEEYMHRWDSGILLMDEFKKSKCLAEPQSEECNPLGEVFDKVADFSICSDQDARGVQFVRGPYKDPNTGGTRTGDFVVDTEKGVVYAGEASQVGTVDPNTGRVTTIEDYVDEQQIVFVRNDCQATGTLDNGDPKPNPKRETVPQRVIELICPDEQVKDYVADPTSGLLRAIQAVCLTAIMNYLRHYSQILKLIKACFETILHTGDGSAGVCEAVLAQYICDLIYYIIKCVTEPSGQGYGTEYDGIRGVFNAAASATGKMKQGVTSRYGDTHLYDVLFVQKKLIHTLCAAAFTGDWDIDWEGLVQEATQIPIKSTIAIGPATRRFISFNPVNGRTTHMYNIGVVAVAGSAMDYTVDLVCSNTGGCDFNGGKCDCAFGEEKVLRVHSEFGTGHLDQGEVLDRAPFIEVPAENLQYSNVRYDKVRFTYTYRNNNGQDQQEIVERPIRQIGGNPPAQCTFNVPSGFLCTFLTDNDGIAYFTEWPEVVYPNTNLESGGHFKIGDRVPIRMQVQTLPGADPEKWADTQKYARVVVKNQHNSEIMDKWYPINEVSSDPKRLIPADDFRIERKHFSQFTSSKASCRAKSTGQSGVRTFSISGSHTTSGTRLDVIFKYDGNDEYTACEAKSSAQTTGDSKLYECISGTETKLKPDLTGALTYNNAIYLEPAKNAKPSPGQAVVLECDAVVNTEVNTCPEEALFSARVSLHSGSKYGGNASTTPEYYDNRVQISDELTVRVRCQEGQDLLKCTDGARASTECICHAGSISTCQAGQFCCADGCHTDGTDCDGNAAPQWDGSATDGGEFKPHDEQLHDHSDDDNDHSNYESWDGGAVACAPIAIPDKEPRKDKFDEWYGEIVYDGSKAVSNAAASRQVTVDFRGKPLTVHERIAPLFDCINQEIELTCDQAGLDYKVGKSYTKGYKPQKDRSGLYVSKHHWGVAFDFNSHHNPYCAGKDSKEKNKVSNGGPCPDDPQKPSDNAVSDYPPCIMEALTKYGFLWGGTQKWQTWEGTPKYKWPRDNHHWTFYGDPNLIGTGSGATATEKVKVVALGDSMITPSSVLGGLKAECNAVESVTKMANNGAEIHDILVKGSPYTYDYMDAVNKHDADVVIIKGAFNDLWGGANSNEYMVNRIKDDYTQITASLKAAKPNVKILVVAPRPWGQKVSTKPGFETKAVDRIPANTEIRDWFYAGVPNVDAVAKTWEIMEHPDKPGHMAPEYYKSLSDQHLNAEGIKVLNDQIIVALHELGACTLGAQTQPSDEFGDYTGEGSTATPPQETATCDSSGDCVVDFPFEDPSLLSSGSKGGRMWVPQEAFEKGGSVPLVIMLHDTNLEKKKHLMIPEKMDLPSIQKLLVQEGDGYPIIMAAPSQTSAASTADNLWKPDKFTVSGFVSAVDAMLTAKLTGLSVDKDNVAIIAHGSAGCDPDTGVNSVIKKVKMLKNSYGITVRNIIMVDTCFAGEEHANILTSSLSGTNTDVTGLYTSSLTDEADFNNFILGLGMNGVSDKVDCGTQVYDDCYEKGNYRMYYVNWDALADKSPNGDTYLGLALWSVVELSKQFPYGGITPAEWQNMQNQAVNYMKSLFG